jgi:hypothetical protein
MTVKLRMTITKSARTCCLERGDLAGRAANVTLAEDADAKLAHRPDRMGFKSAVLGS